MPEELLGNTVPIWLLPAQTTTDEKQNKSWTQVLAPTCTAFCCWMSWNRRQARSCSTTSHPSQQTARRGLLLMICEDLAEHAELKLLLVHILPSQEEIQYRSGGCLPVRLRACHSSVYQLSFLITFPAAKSTHCPRSLQPIVPGEGRETWMTEAFWCEKNIQAIHK